MTNINVEGSTTFHIGGNIMTPAEIKRAIHAFNERLRQAESDYGDNSDIVNQMKDKARFYLDLKWTKKNGKDYRISSKSNITDMNQFEKFVVKNNAPALIEQMLTEEMKEEVNNFKGKARKDYIREAYHKVSATLSLLETIWSEVYDETGDPRTSTEIYDMVKSKEYVAIVYEYYDGQISLRELIDRLKNEEEQRLFGEYEEWTDEDFDALSK